MKGTVKIIRFGSKGKYGFISGDNGEDYYFDGRYLEDGIMEDYCCQDAVEFCPVTDTSGIHRHAGTVRYMENRQSLYDEEDIRKKVEEMPIAFYRYGYFNHIDKQRMREEHLKPDSGEWEVLEKLAEILYISHVNHHDIGYKTLFPFCLVGATEVLKQYIRGKYEFLLIFSHFDNEDWQHSTVQAAKFIRQRKEISARRPLVNFYILISNARNLKVEIDKMKGGTAAAIIPFSFAEILKCTDAKTLTQLILARFDEYLFENNMLGEENEIEEDTLLFGDRGKIADSIVQRCTEGKHSGIFGLRRSGKSSVLKAVERRLIQGNIKFITIQARTSLEGIDSWKTALYDIAREIRRNTLGIEQEKTETRSTFNERLLLSSTEADYQKRPSQCFVEDIRHYLKNEERFVIAIDEVELITYNTATSSMWQDLNAYKGFWGALRDSGCSLIICGVNSTINEKSTIIYKGQTCDNPMYERIHNCAGFSRTYLPSFTDEQTKVMINTLGGYSNIAFSNVYVDINRAFGGQPYAIRQFCAYLFERVKEFRIPHKVYEVSKPAFDAYLTEFNNSEKGTQLFNTILQHVAIYKEEYEMLKRMALSPEKYRKVEHGEISLIDHIEKYGLIEYDKSTLFVTFNIQSMQEYICKISTKRPEDMNNDERRQYIQDKVMICEKKLKKYILNYYTYNRKESAGRRVIQNLMKGKNPIIKINGKAVPVPDPNTCKFKDFFDHSKYILFFSSLKKIMINNWNELGKSFCSMGITENKFRVYMEDLNAGRIDADHYDAEDMNCPTEWEISDRVLDAFSVAYAQMEDFFEAYNL